MDGKGIRQSFIIRIYIRMNVQKVVRSTSNTAWLGAVLQKEELYE